MDDFHGCDVDTYAGGHEHPDGFGFHDGTCVGAGGEFGDHLAVALGEEGFGAGATDGGAVAGGGSELVRDRHALLDEFRGGDELLECCFLSAGDVLGG